MAHPHAVPTRSLPDRPNLAQLRKQAKELLKSYLAGQQPAVAEVERFERNPDLMAFSLSDAQRVLARAYGFRSWTRLKQHIDGMHVRAFCDAAVWSTDAAKNDYRWIRWCRSCRRQLDGNTGFRHQNQSAIGRSDLLLPVAKRQ